MHPRASLRAATARARAWWWLRPGRAIILDTETTDFDGEIIEITIVDAATGAVILDSLVRPDGQICPDAAKVHGITHDMCATAPTWTQLWPQVEPILSSHLVLAYNAPYDHGRITAACQRHHLPVPRARWRCIMRLDAAARNGRWRKLDAGHRACADTLAARDVLCQIAEGSRS